MLAFYESLTSAAPSSLVDTVVSTIGLTNKDATERHLQMQLFVAKVIGICTVKELEQTTKYSVSAIQTLVDASEELADMKCGDVHALLRDCGIQRVLSSLQIPSDSEVEKQVRDLLLQDGTLVKALLQGPDKVALRAIQLVAEKDQKLFREIGEPFCKEVMGRWLNDLQQTSGIALKQEEGIKIVGAVMRVFDAELAGLLLLLSPSFPHSVFFWCYKR